MRIICSHSYVNKLVIWYKSCKTRILFVLKNTRRLKALTLTSLLCKPLQHPLIKFRILCRKATHRLAFCWQLQFSINEVCLVFSPATDHGLADSVFPGDLGIISTASASATIFSLKARLYNIWRALGMITDWLLTLANDWLWMIVWERFLNSDCLLNAVH